MIFKRKNRYYYLAIIIIVISILSFFSRDFSQNILDKKYFGKSYNITRIEKGIPIVEDKWKILKINPNNVLWGYKYLPFKDKPIHFRKHIFVNNKKIESEKDTYHYRINDTIEERIIYKFKYGIEESSGGLWECQIIRYKIDSMILDERKFGKSKTESYPITLNQADSIMSTWGINRFNK